MVKQNMQHPLQSISHPQLSPVSLPITAMTLHSSQGQKGTGNLTMDSWDPQNYIFFFPKDLEDNLVRGHPWVWANDTVNSHQHY